MLAHLPRLLLPFARNATISIDMTERSHGLMRTDLHSSGRARNTTASSSRTFCRQAMAEHVSHGGKDMSTVPLADLVSNIGSDACTHEPANTESRHAGSSFIRFRSVKLRNFKHAQAPRRSLTTDELTKFENEVREAWSKTKPEIARQWQSLNALANAERRSGALPRPAALCHDDTPFCSLWGSSGNNPAFLVAPNEIVEFQREAKIEQTLAHHDPSVFVSSPVPQRCSSAIDAGAMRGCFWNKKNICRQHVLSPGDRHLLDGLVDRLKRWVDVLGRELARSCTQFVWFHGDKGEGRFVDTVALLADVRYRPKMQMFARCHLRADSQEAEFFVCPDLPYTISLSVRPSRLARAVPALYLQTSDELCMSLLEQCRTWEIIPVAARILCHHDTLLQWEIIGHDEAFQEAVVVRRAPRSRAAQDLPDEFDLGDPVAFGLAQVSSAAGRSPLGDAADEAQQRVPLHDVDEVSDGQWSDPEAYDGVAPDCLEDIEEALLETSNLPANSGGADGIAAGSVDPFSNPGPEVVCDLEQALEPILDTDVPPADEPAAPCAGDAALGAQQNARGYITSTIEPWRSHGGLVGRISTWGRNVSMKCYMHIGCSVAKARHTVSDEFLKRWLFSAIPPAPHCIGIERSNLGRQHMDEFQRMFSNENRAA